jgi:hypothetical protein
MNIGEIRENIINAVVRVYNDSLKDGSTEKAVRHAIFSTLVIFDNESSESLDINVTSTQTGPEKLNGFLHHLFIDKINETN